MAPRKSATNDAPLAAAPPKPAGFQEYPKTLFGKGEKEKIVASAEEHAAASGKGWYDHPDDVV